MDDEMTPDTVTSDGQIGDGAPVFDERAFIKAAKRRSTRRIVLISGVLIAAVAVTLLAGTVWRQRAVYGQAGRILAYYPTLVSITYPNTKLMYPEAVRSQFPGAVDEYTAYRRVGDVAIPAGDAFVAFGLWGGEVAAHGPGDRFAGLGARLFEGSDLAPALRFLEPAARGGAATRVSAEAFELARGRISPPLFRTSEPATQTFAKVTQSSLARLSAAPPSSTVEVAVSFRDMLTLSVVETLLGPSLDFYWGATDAYPHPAVPFEQTCGYMVGVDFVHEAPGLYHPDTSHRESEQQLIAALKQIAQHAPKVTAGWCQESAAYLEKNGIRYYGIVVCGSPKAALELAQRPEVTAVSLGAVVQPWE